MINKQRKSFSCRVLAHRANRWRSNRTVSSWFVSRTRSSLVTISFDWKRNSSFPPASPRYRSLFPPVGSALPIIDSTQFINRRAESTARSPNRTSLTQVLCSMWRNLFRKASPRSAKVFWDTPVQRRLRPAAAISMTKRRLFRPSHRTTRRTTVTRLHRGIGSVRAKTNLNRVSSLCLTR